MKTEIDVCQVGFINSHRQRELFLNAFIKAQGHISRRPNRTFKMLHAALSEPLFHDLFRLMLLARLSTFINTHTEAKGIPLGFATENLMV